MTKQPIVKEQPQIHKNHIDEYFSKQEQGSGTELFRIDDTNSDIKSELTEDEIRLINTLKMNDDFLVKNGITAVFANYYKNFLRLKVSLNRKGRSEYVEINRNDNSESTLNKLSAFSNVMGVKK